MFVLYQNEAEMPGVQGTLRLGMERSNDGRQERCRETKTRGRKVWHSGTDFSIPDSFLEFVSPLYLKAAPDSTLKMSTLAVASCLFTAWLNRRSDTPFSRSFYLRAVSAMKDQIVNAENCSNDEMLLSILLLQFFEVCVRCWPQDILYRCVKPS